MSFFQMSETGSSKAASQSCSDSGNLPDDPDKLSRIPDCKSLEFILIHEAYEEGSHKKK